jgi:L-lactate utilization protein LutC
MAIIRVSNIVSSAIINSAITEEKIANGAVTSAKIADGAVATADLQSGDDFGLLTGSLTATDDYGSIA